MSRVERRRGSLKLDGNWNQRVIKNFVEEERRSEPTSKKIVKAEENKLRVERRTEWQIMEGRRRLDAGEPLSFEYRDFLKRHGVAG